MQVQVQNKPFCFIEPTLLEDNSILNLVSIKAPLLSVDNRIAGIFGVSNGLENKSLNEILQRLLAISEIVKLQLDLGPMISLMTQIMKIKELQNIWKKNRPLFDYGQVIFNFREAQCLHYFLNHYSAQKTSEKLFISPKTVESHLVKIKKKLNCYDTSQISKLAIEHGFIELMFMKF
ncbi:MAG: response regulator transcription factor [Tatlockia sp.]|nr:response regulator transcription factor [Tatlockia sp.]